MARCYIALGANLGDRLATLRAAAAAIAELGVVRARSSVWETEAVGPPPDYYNAVLEIEPASDLLPSGLLDRLLAIEARHGRVRPAVRDAPRTIDLDLLLWDDRILDTPRLRLPHPRMHERGFVLHPLAEIAPRAVHPRLGLTVSELLDRLPRGRRLRRLGSPL